MKVATIHDLEKALPLAKKFYEDCQFKNSFDQEYFLQVWANLLASGFGRIYIREDEGEIIEAIGVIVADGSMNKIRTATIQFWFIGGDGSLANGLLFNSVLEELGRLEVHLVQVNALIRYRYDKMKSFLQKSGFEPKEVSFERALAC